MKPDTLPAGNARVPKRNTNYAMPVVAWANWKQEKE